MSFVSTGLRPAIRDVTRPVDLEVEFLGTDPTGPQGEERIGFSARERSAAATSALPSAWPPTAPKIIVADRVDIVLDVEAFLEA